MKAQLTKHAVTSAHTAISLGGIGLLIFIISVSSFYGCAHTVDYVSKTDTATVIHHDTIPGPAFVRFLSVINNFPLTPSITFRNSYAQNAQYFGQADQTMTKQFYPIPSDSTFFLYATWFFKSDSSKLDSVGIPRLRPFSMTSIAIYRTNDPNDPDRLFATFADDSTRSMLAPKNKCYIRLVNGLGDWPQPVATVNMHIDDVNAPPFFKDNVNYQDIRNYMLMPAGPHTIYVRSETDPTISYYGLRDFLEGQFYTVRLTGSHAGSSDQLTIDAE
ncbi:MAG: hypothetical protein WCH46_03725 [bacterium]